MGDQQLKDKKKEALKRQEKSIEVRNRTELKLEEEAQTLRAQLDKAQERSTNKLMQIRADHEQHVASKSQFWDALAVRLRDHEQDIFDGWMETHHETNRKQKVVADNKIQLEL